MTLRDGALRAGIEAARLAVGMLDARAAELRAHEREHLGRARLSLERADEALTHGYRERSATELRDVARLLAEISDAAPESTELTAAINLAREVSR